MDGKPQASSKDSKILDTMTKRQVLAVKAWVELSKNDPGLVKKFIAEIVTSKKTLTGNDIWAILERLTDGKAGRQKIFLTQ